MKEEREEKERKKKKKKKKVEWGLHVPRYVCCNEEYYIKREAERERKKRLWTFESTQHFFFDTKSNHTKIANTRVDDETIDLSTRCSFIH